jgi:uncharacterized protein YjbI with pentapeptide repeats
MAACTHPYQDAHASCPHLASADGGRCLWHSPSVEKSDAYVRDLLKQADLASQGDLTDFHLAGLHWPAAQLPQRILIRADVRDAYLDGADLTGCDLSSATLRRTSLKRAILRGAALRGADLTGTNLTDADLRDADLSGAQLSGTVLNGCDLRGANLAGAHIADFSWNRRTRFAGVKGLDADRATRGDGDQTQAFPAPLALAGAAAGELSALEDPDPELCRTRLYAPVVTTTHAQPAPQVSTVVAPRPSRGPRLALAASLVLAIGGLGAAAWSLQRTAPAAVPTASAVPDQRLARELANLQQQHEADLEQIRLIQGQLRESTDARTAAKQEAAMRRAEAESLRATLRATESDLLRMHGADDRATLMAQRLTELTRMNNELMRETGRHEQVGRILADGVGRLKQENGALVAERDQQQIDRRQLADSEAEAGRLREAVATLTSERDAAVEAKIKLTGDLLAASRDIERYLARVNATHLQDYLTDDHSRIPLLAVAAGKPVALAGDYLLTLRVDRGSQPGTITTQVVVQRPSSAGNPDVTVVLYDADQQPLRRLAYSFPHVDAGKPFLSTSSEVTCERFPAYARVMIAPGLDGLSAKR